jgi:hypothetical protein
VESLKQQLEVQMAAAAAAAGKAAALEAELQVSHRQTGCDLKIGGCCALHHRVGIVM